MATLSFDAQYICWVQRALIRNAWPDVKVNGIVSEAYRDVVRRFQTENGLKRTGDVDSPTQDRLIKLNHIDVDYTAWVQNALIAAGLLSAAKKGHEPIMERASSATRQAIKRFQKRPGSGLSGDGWVGVKTELALMQFSTTAPPDDTGKPAPCRFDPKPSQPDKPGTAKDQEKRLAGRLLSVMDLIRADQNPVRGRRLLCIISQLTSHIVDGDPFDDTYRPFPSRLPLGSQKLTLHFKDQLIRRYLESDDRSLVVGLNTLYQDIVEPIQHHVRALQRLLLEPPHPISLLRNTEECKVVAYYLNRARNASSIYHCFSAWILKTFEVCDGAR